MCTCVYPLKLDFKMSMEKAIFPCTLTKSAIPILLVPFLRQKFCLIFTTLGVNVHGNEFLQS